MSERRDEYFADSQKTPNFCPRWGFFYRSVAKVKFNGISTFPLKKCCIQGRAANDPSVFTITEKAPT